PERSRLPRRARRGQRRSIRARWAPRSRRDRRPARRPRSSRGSRRPRARRVPRRSRVARARRPPRRRVARRCCPRRPTGSSRRGPPGGCIFYLRASIKRKPPMQPRSAAPRPVRHRSHGLQTRAEIVAAAERHFAERGFEATRLDDIATEVGIRRAAIFYYFPDKHELYAAVLDEVFGDWTAALPTDGSPAERIEASLVAWVEYVARRPSVARLILREAATAQPGVV